MFKILKYHLLLFLLKIFNVLKCIINPHKLKKNRFFYDGWIHWSISSKHIRQFTNINFLNSGSRWIILLIASEIWLFTKKSSI